MSKKKRNREQILASVLGSAISGATKTRIMYASFLSFRQLEKYLSYMLETRLVELDSRTGKYLTTSRGLEFLKHFEELQRIENNFIEKRMLLSEFLEVKSQRPL